jgi:cytochrome c
LALGRELIGRAPALSTPNLGRAMDSFELTKISGAVLAALLLIFAPKTLGALSGGEKASEGTVTAGYELPKPTPAKAEAGAAGAAAPAAGPFDSGAVLKLLASAKPENGEATFKRCASCHVNDKAAKSGTAPNLWGLVGRKKGSREDFGGYSDAMKAKGGDWTFAELAAFLHNPKDWMPGTKMNIAIGEPTELADLLSYLRTLSDSPAALPQ